MSQGVRAEMEARGFLEGTVFTHWIESRWHGGAMVAQRPVSLSRHILTANPPTEASPAGVAARCGNTGHSPMTLSPNRSHSRGVQSGFSSFPQPRLPDLGQSRASPFRPAWTPLPRTHPCDHRALDLCKKCAPSPFPGVRVKRWRVDWLCVHSVGPPQCPKVKARGANSGLPKSHLLHPAGQGPWEPRTSETVLFHFYHYG